jgi:hypothetical protein
MLNPELLRFTPSGCVFAANNGVTSEFNGGTPTNDLTRQLSLSPDGVPDVFLGGLGYRFEGQLCTTLTGTASSYVGGVALDATGRVLAAEDGTPEFITNGLPLTAEGRLCIQTTITPIVRGFDNGFSLGFGA